MTTWCSPRVTSVAQTRANTSAMSFNGTPLGQGRRLDRSTFLGKNQHNIPHQRLIARHVASFSFQLIIYQYTLILARQLPQLESPLCRPQTTIINPRSSATHVLKSENKLQRSIFLSVRAARELSPRLQTQKSGRSRIPPSTSQPLSTRLPQPYQTCRPFPAITITPGLRALIGPTPLSPGVPPSSTKRKHSRPPSRAVWHLPLRV